MKVKFEGGEEPGTVLAEEEVWLSPKAETLRKI